MKRALFMSLVVMGTAGLAAQTAPQGELARLQGQWVATGMAGQAIPVGVQTALIVTGNKYEGVENGKVTESGTVTVDSTKKPATLDFAIAVGSDAGKTQLCLVEVAGDTATIALGQPGDGVRPSSFTGGLALTLARIKPLTKDLEGTWDGVLDANGTPLRLAFKLANGANGLATGTLISIDQGNSELPVTAVILRGARVTLIVPGARGTFDGQLKDGQLTGTWAQAAVALPLVLKRKN